jgi:hypothetical protein
MFTYITLALATVASVSGLAIPRDGKPATYGDWLENYDQYHTRYLAIGCKGKQGTPFFETCCRPMLKNEVLEKARPAQCIPASTAVVAANPTSTVSAAPSATEGADDDDDWCYEGDEGCDCVNDAEPTGAPEGRPNTTVQPTTTPAPATTSAPAPVPTMTQPATNNGNGQVVKGGHATYFYQNGVAGACGKVHQESDLVAALPGAYYGNYSQRSDKCGKTIRVTRTSNGKSVDVIVADACPSCGNPGDVDLSQGAFRQLGTDEEGMFDISYEWLN